MSARISVVIKCYQDHRIYECLESIDERCEVIIAYSGEQSLSEEIADRYPEVRIIQAPIGNLSVSCNLGISASTGNSILIMDSDSKFKSGSLSLIKEHIKENLVVKPRIIYEYKPDVFGSRFVAITRQKFNDREIRALTPGLAFRKDIAKLIGGFFFDDNIPFTEDAVLDWRIKKAGIDIRYLPEAIVYHSPTSAYHDLRAAYRMGYGHRLAVQFIGRENDNSFMGILKRFMTGESFKQFVQEGVQEGYAVSFYMSLWSFFYNIGYLTEGYRILLAQIYKKRSVTKTL